MAKLQRLQLSSMNHVQSFPHMMNTSIGNHQFKPRLETKKKRLPQFIEGNIYCLATNYHRLPIIATTK